ncbi:MAG: hypothetical protein EXX96DRAFT_550629 [Benjaminiella poitrasii]|nr:MAG: hypothetical protein EXX96DRAFT_550629 [Benjaminiella poitrasii]
MSNQQAINAPMEIMDEVSPMDEDLPDVDLLIESMNLSSIENMQNKIPNFEKLIKLPENQLRIVIPSINFTSWPDDITADLLKKITDTKNISSLNALLLIHAAIYSKVIALSSSAPRLLMNSIIQTAKGEGKHVMDGLIIPLLFQSDLSRPQVEVILKTISESLSSLQRFSLLQIILSDGEIYFSNEQNKIVSNDNRKYLRPWNDVVFQIINSILSTQPLIHFTKNSLFDLIQPIRLVVQSNPKDKGSMQLLLLLTSKYSQALIEFSAIDSIEEICDISSMFLKRAVHGQITSIRKKYEETSKML